MNDLDDLHQLTAHLVHDDAAGLPTPPSPVSPLRLPLPLPPSLVGTSPGASSSTSLARRSRKASTSGQSSDGKAAGEGSSSTKSRVRAYEKRNTPPRPANAWICYRSARVQELKSSSSQYSKLPQADISKIIGQLWRSEPPEVRRQYEEMAERKKAEHKEKHPDYVFRPVRRKASKGSSKKAAPSPPPPCVVNSIPSVLQRPPSPAASVCTCTRSSYPGDIDVSSLGLPTPALTAADLPVPPPFFDTPCPVQTSSQDWSQSLPPLDYQLPPSPAWSTNDAFAFVAPSQVELTASATFSPTLQHANAFLDGGYLTPPPLATESLFGDYWTAGSGEFIELPSSFA
ncbi:hypothetical protein JCM10213_005171 [Rhodosporidiobolus nylandii]